MFDIEVCMSPFLINTGVCITSAAPGQMCGLNSVAAECDSLTATACDCIPGYVSEDGLTCSGIIIVDIIYMAAWPV